MRRIKSIAGFATRFARAGAQSVRTRAIDIPEERLAAINTLPQLLEAAYHFGQNDFQQRDCPSVSAGDVVAIDFAGWGLRHYRCLMVGWAETSSTMAVFGPDAEELQPNDMGVC